MADLRAALGHALEPAYRVEREVRPVGNCRMFVALEKSAGGGLLVKVLPGALSLAVDSSRFEQEIARLGRRLRHPSLVAPRNAGRVGSFVYHTRAFVEGTTLRAWLARHGAPPARCAAASLAPERRAGQPAPATRDDMFAVGVLVHEMLTGRPPAGNPEPLEEVRSVPDWLAELGRRCRAAEPSARWADAGSALASGSWPSGGGT